MASSSILSESVESRQFRGRIIVRRFTDQLVGTNDLEQLTIAAQEDEQRQERLEEEERRRQLFQDTADDEPSVGDFDVAEIAKAELQRMVDEFAKDARLKVPMRQQLGFSSKSAKQKAAELLEDALHNDFPALKASIDKLETKWKEDHGSVYRGFKRLTDTLDAHRSAFAIFPSQNNYASVLCGSVSCLLKAARNHRDIAEAMSKYMAEISAKVALCSEWLHLIRTRNVRQRLAQIYARMFQFYGDVITWYLHSKGGRTLLSFNENLRRKFDDASRELEAAVAEFYRLLSLCTSSMITLMYDKVTSMESELTRQRQNYRTQDPSAGHRMVIMLEGSYNDSRFERRTIEPAVADRIADEPANLIQDVTVSRLTREQGRRRIPALKPFIFGDEGSGLMNDGQFHLVEDELLPKLRSWMTEDKVSRILWISSSLEGGGVNTAAKAAALGVVTAAWQAESPILSYFCRRPQKIQLLAEMSLEQGGILGLVYSLVSQLLDFYGADDNLDIREDELAALDGSVESWDISLNILKVLLGYTPVLMFCVIDGLNMLEWGSGSDWCEHFLNVLVDRQRRAGSVFNILLTTSGQSRILPCYVLTENRHLTRRGTRDLSRNGRRVDL